MNNITDVVEFTGGLTIITGLMCVSWIMVWLTIYFCSKLRKKIHEEPKLPRLGTRAGGPPL